MYGLHQRLGQRATNIHLQFTDVPRISEKKRERTRPPRKEGLEVGPFYYHEGC